MEPRELLVDYALGLLDEEAEAAVDAYLETSAEARAELRALRATMAAVAEAPSTLERMVAELTPVPPPATTLRGLRRRLRAGGGRRGWPWAAAASVALLASALWWGYGERRQARQALAERDRLGSALAAAERGQELIRRYLERPDEVRIVALRGDDGAPVGTALFLDRGLDGRVLFLMSAPPPAGRSYQVWGHKGDFAVALGVSQDAVFETTWQGFEAIGVSLEPAGGSPRPSGPLALIPLS